ncbi:ROK family transcriptional regulator [Propionibacteriaceae bacterium G57]|uniref:ROK family transcriptional regulator n=1 Tax=Aestuariimicrobium sp. G57 TaxID=3418485 RepID=UPI003DA767AC
MSRGTAAPRANRNPGSQPALRRQNTQRVLETLAQGGPTTQAKLARATGLSTGTISNIVKDLHAEHKIITRPVVDSGRRAIEISLNDSRTAVGLDIDATSMRMVLTHMDHAVISEVIAPLPFGHRPADTLRRARMLMDEHLDRAGIPRGDVIGVGVSLPTILDHERKPLVHDPGFPEWFGNDLAALAGSTFTQPVHFENDANVQALAHVTWGPYSLSSIVATVKASSGIGAGLMVHGHIMRGAFGGTGEIGHLQIVPLGELCHCGNRGCLQAVASVDHVLANIRRVKRLHDTPSIDDVVALARRRDPAALKVFDEAGRAIGTALASLVTLVNPHAIVISGPLAPVGSALLDPISRSMTRYAHPAIGPRTVVSMSQLGPRAEALGAAALAAQSAVAAAS